MAFRGASSRRYAEGIFAIAKEQNAYDRWLGDLETLRSVFANPDMAAFLADPKARLSQKEDVVQKLLEGKVERLTVNLALLLLRREQAEIVPDVERELQRMVNAERNVAVADVTTAVELEGQQREVVKQRLEALTAKHIELRTNVDTSILGGFVARVGDVLIDASVATRLATLRQDLLAHT